MSNISINELNYNDADFKARLAGFLSIDEVADAQLLTTVDSILADVKARGNEAVIEYTNKFDRLNVKSIDELTLKPSDFKAAFDRLNEEEKHTLVQSAKRIRDYHEKQSFESFQYQDVLGNTLGQKVTPINRVGLYAPAGLAPLASSVLMNAIPAKVAGVKELIMMSPSPDGKVNDFLLGAAHVAQVDELYCIGGAQAIAAFAYGTQTLAKVDKITGPGNAYVATAKQKVFGTVGIDMVAGPSEILVICDGKTDPDWIAMDLFSQAEHDTDAQSILVTQDAKFAKSVIASMEKLIDDMPRFEIIKQSLKDRGLVIVVDNDEQAIEIANIIAAEHVEISVENTQKFVDGIDHAGAMFVGRYSAEALGDYAAGPNHVLPTSGTTRFSSPLSVYDFQKRTSIINCTQQGAKEIAKLAESFGYSEGLQAHAKSAAYRK
ncbi:MAG: histidinol dehydrogenase [Saccharospirillaceae bacterium]|nr:histidinol dehydrogenase [Pseudomonadales bacterium]NRB79641.1 histidinol dehydrogenase [Saccharospirillaceae bacterium]